MPMKQVGTGRQPHEILVLVAAVVIGISGTVLPDVINPATYHMFGEPGGRIFFATLTIFAFITLWGIREGKIDGLLRERAGLLVLACFFIAFAVATLHYRGVGGLASANFPLSLAAANLWRMRQITCDLRDLKEHLKNGQQ